MSVLIGTEFDDTLTGDADSDNTIFGDPIDERIPPGNDHLTGGSNSTNLISGDVEFLEFTGGADVLIGGESSTNRMFGDATDSFQFARGGDDVLTGGNDSVNIMSGDAGGDLEPLFAHGVNSSFGGNDTLVGGARSANTMFGDATGSFLASFGGDDVLTGGNDSVNTMSGDAGGDLESVPERGHLRHSIGGNDTLVGGERSANTMFGDAAGAIVSSFGGDDTLIAGDGGTNTMIGDALVLADEGLGGSTGGDDLLVSGTGTDDMWGDAKQVLDGSVGGHDVFRFLADNGNDTIHDFERGKDLIEVSVSLLPASVGTGARLAAFAAPAQSVSGPMSIEERDANGDGATDSIIHFDVENSVTVLGVTGLTSDDIVAAPGSSYILFSHTSIAGFDRSTWGPGLGSAGGDPAPGNPDVDSAFDADLLTLAQLLAGNGKLFDISSGANAALAAFGSGGVGTPLFAPAGNTTLVRNAVGGGVIDLAQIDANWNGIKNIEIRLDSDSDITAVRIENIVDTRVKIGGDVSDITADGPGARRFDVDLIGVKRGEVDASLASAALDLRIDVWSNSAVGQNSFDIKGTVFDDVVNIGAGSVSGSMFGRPPGEGSIYLGDFTTTFTNLGAGEDIFDSSNAIGSFLSAPFFGTTDKVWGGTGDDVIHTDNGDDKLFGDNGSGVNFYADPALRPLTPAADGNDVLDAGNGADFLQGDSDRGAAVFATGNFINIGASGGDRLFLGRAGFKERPGPEDVSLDTVNYRFGDGFDVVRQFGLRDPTHTVPKVSDKVTFDTDGHTATVNDVNTSEGLSTWISTVEDPSHGVLVIGVTGLVTGTDIILS